MANSSTAGATEAGRIITSTAVTAFNRFVNMMRANVAAEEKHNPTSSASSAAGQPAATSVPKTLDIEAITPAADELESRIQNLPQELQDEIREHLVAFDLGPISISETWKPPLGLQIDHKSREKFAVEYFGVGATMRDLKYKSPHTSVPILKFLCSDPIHEACNRTARWFRMLGKPHQQLVQGVQFDIEALIGTPGGEPRRDVVGGLEEIVGTFREIINGSDEILIKPGGLSFKAKVKEDDGSIGDVTIRERADVMLPISASELLEIRQQMPRSGRWR